MGTFLTWILSTQVLGHPLVFGKIYLLPSLASGYFTLRVTVEDVGFGNPPGFPHPYFIACKSVLLTISIDWATFQNLFALILPENFKQKMLEHFEQVTPLRRKGFNKVRSKLFSTSRNGKSSKQGEGKSNEREKDQKEDKVVTKRRLGVLVLERLEFNQVDLNFELCDGMFNINGFSKLIAVGECKRLGNMKKTQPIPNKLEVSIIRARGLKAADYDYISGKGTSDPFVKVKCRTEEVRTRTNMYTCTPMYNEKFEIHCDDPSAVLHITVWDEDIGVDDFLGQWYCTVKWLLIKGQVTGWVKLKDKDFNEGTSGEMEIEVKWVYDNNFEGWKKPRQTALEQLQENSDETNLRLGNTKKVQRYLEDFPFLFDVDKIVFRDIVFHLKDLFAGYTGSAEKSSKDPSVGGKDVVKVSLLQLTKADVLKLAEDQQGFDLWVIINKLILGIAPQVMKMNTVFGGLSAIFGGLGTNIGSSLGLVRTPAQGARPSTITNGENGRLKRDSSPALSGLQTNTDAAAPGITARIERHVSRVFGKKVGSHLNADDTDFLLEGGVYGYLDMRKRKGLHKWKPRFILLKGNTMFYSKVVAKQVAWTRAVSLTQCSNVSYDPKKENITLKMEGTREKQVEPYLIYLQPQKNLLGSFILSFNAGLIQGDPEVAYGGAWQYITVQPTGDLWRWERNRGKGWFLDDAAKAKEFVSAFDFSNFCPTCKGIPSTGPKVCDRLGA
ncbi:hypothetical protein CYMTET_10910 [Cymbomonas tetramitiformis]|uniref:C2 domain-containing protein n=1 Tax=Cymbomonas tetramitiformis TaxID=36881 RepID=A0AAE0GND0_9CHLO|nr:hypothetical protein CYMTET_10910 [Cymbomonas tetramitiformis]